MYLHGPMDYAKKSETAIPCRGVQYVQLTTFSRRWLTHTVYETKGVSPHNGWLVAFHWVRVRVRVSVSIYIYIILKSMSTIFSKKRPRYPL